MRALAVALLALVVPATARAATLVAPLPADVRDALATMSSIDVGAPTGAPGDLPVTASAAKRLVRRDFSRDRARKIGVYLVRITGHPNPLEPLLPGREGWTSIGPLQVGDLAWIAVIRNVRLSIVSAPRDVRGTLVVLVETTRPHWITALEIPTVLRRRA